MDSTGSVSLTLFDRQVHPIIDNSAAELLQEGDMDILPTDFNKLIEKTYAFKVNIKDFNIEKDKHTYGISHLTDDTNIINEMIKKESDDQGIQSNSQSIALELVSQPASSFMSPPFESKRTKDVLSVTGDNIASCDDEKSTATSPGKSKFLSVIDVDNDPLFLLLKRSCFLQRRERKTNDNMRQLQNKMSCFIFLFLQLLKNIEQHDVIATPQGVGSSLSANVPDTSLVPRRRGRPMKEILNGHCSAAFSSDSSLEKTPSSLIMSNQTQANTNTPFYDTDLLPRHRGKPPLTDILNGADHH
uniref:Nucleic acid-binding, OB-fold protein n=1 Tax=Tanacetum cinerariifolium TaxID=118510 RepID=A0A6L2MUJ0_TANCI|nr:hypothetical protein [Tanacetum cinerariifolium]